MPRVTINNVSIEVEEGTSLLKAARELGVEVPTLCYWEGVRPMNSCMLCVVRDSKTGRLLPSCSTVAQEGMEIETDSGDVCAARKEVLELMISEHMGDCEAPCSHTCPASMNIPLMMRQVYEGDFKNAAVTVTDGLVFPWTLGYVCPAPCESPCRRKQLDETMQIRSMHANIAEKMQHKVSEIYECLPGTGSKVAVIGGSIQGMAAAWVLQKRGHACTVYEKESYAGGKLRLLPHKELPSGVLDEEIDRLGGIGIAFEYGREMTGGALDALLPQYDAVILACKGAGEATGKIFEAAGHKLHVRAVNNGKTAAQWVDRYLKSVDTSQEKESFKSRMGKMAKPELEAMRKHNENRQVFDVIPVKSNLAASQEEAARCLHCDCRKRLTCSLRKWSTEYGVEERKFKTTEAQDFRIIGLGDIVFEPGKCIKCGLCVEIAKMHDEDLGLTFIGRGFEVQIKVPFNKSLDEGLTKSADECIAACPTAALSFRNREDIGYDVQTKHRSLSQ